MANIGGRWAVRSPPACFLSRFAKKYDWAHLDVPEPPTDLAAIREQPVVPALPHYLLARSGKPDAGKASRDPGLLLSRSPDRIAGRRLLWSGRPGDRETCLVYAPDGESARIRPQLVDPECLEFRSHRRADSPRP